MTSLAQCIAIAVIALAPAACLHHHAAANSTGSEPATLQVDNRNWQDVDIEVLHRGIRSHLGSVNAATTREFQFPQSLLGDLGEVQLIAHAIGTPFTITTNVIVLKPGTQVRWSLETTLSSSTIAVY
jgi:hypothetical protein